MKRIIFTVTNDLRYDQRMIRICSSMTEAGYAVTFVGRSDRRSPLLEPQSFRQKRLFCLFNKGPLFYIEYNIRLFLWLLFQSRSILCAIDLDTILPIYYTSRLKGCPRVYDAHELFCEMKEVVSRPRIYRIWKWIERHTVPHFKIGYTVNEPIAAAFKEMYGHSYAIVRNMPFPTLIEDTPAKERFFIYQGAVNEGRSFETLIPAMQWVPAQLHIYGDGNFMQQSIALVKQYCLEDKVLFKGKRPPQELVRRTPKAWAGLTLFEASGQSNIDSLANRFFDYVQAGIPQITSDYPVYRSLNNLYEVAVLIKDLSPKALAACMNSLLADPALHERLRSNSLKARQMWHWKEEEKILRAFYEQNFSYDAI